MSRVFIRGAIGFRTKNGMRNCSGAVANTAQVQMEPAPLSSLSAEQPKAKYPPILDLSRAGKGLRKREEWEEAIKKLKTVEEKLIKVNMPRFYGWKCWMVKDGNVPVHSLEHFQQITKTQMIVRDSLPDSYLPLAAAAEYHAQQLRPKIEEAIFIEHQGIKRNITYEKDISEKVQDEKFISKSFLKQVNRILLNYLSSNVPHLAETHMDIEPRLESFWIVGGLDPPKTIVRKRFVNYWMTKEEQLEPVDRHYQTLCTPVLTLRNKHPLDPILTETEVKNLEYDVPYNRYAPESIGIQYEHRHGTCIPGFWPGHTYEFGSLAYYTREYLVDLPDSFSEEDRLDILHANAILSSFGWLNTLACYQGFSTFNDITYPLTTQTVVSNGQYWSFYTYQLNTLLMNGKYIDDEGTKNVCYATNPLKLYDSIDADGKVVGFNEEVLKILMQYYLNPPKEREGVELKPYMTRNIHYAANFHGEERRSWLEEFYKLLVSNKPRMRLDYEIYDWERIYKIQFKMRPLEKKMRPFELNQNPWLKPMDDHALKYVPKALRVGSYKDRKFRRNYYP